MRLVDEFRDAEAVAGLREAIARRLSRPAKIMEVCGTHTMAIARAGVRQLLPPTVSLISGPGCPVCVTAQGEIDAFLALGECPGVVLASFGDMLRVPGSTGSLETLKARGTETRVVYSPMDAVRLAAASPEKEVVFFGIGFETTVPTVAAALLEACRLGLRNFSVLSAHKRVPPALAALATDPELAVDGFLLPGHVSVILGLEPYRFLAEQHQIPCAIAGFEVTDILEGILHLVTQIADGRAALANQYPRVVRPEGNPTARALMERVFTPTDAVWRGIGPIAASGLALRPEFAPWDARQKFALDWDRFANVPEPPACRCGDILKGIASPHDCPLFGRGCTPARPIGPCMVSSEGTCAAYYRYQIG
ncbi:MAG: hydrogenase formation protein HypD [Armatimonadetes bacterium]|nr:hydrogenase formation protein HypD [Armatimonadota bacterium]